MPPNTADFVRARITRLLNEHPYRPLAPTPANDHGTHIVYKHNDRVFEITVKEVSN